MRSPYFPRLMGTCTISYQEKREGDEKNRVKSNTFVTILVPYSRPILTGTYLQATLVSTIYYFSLPLFEHCVESVPGSRWTWAQKAGRLNRSLDHGPNPPLFGLLPSSEDRPPAPVAATHYRDAMCVTAWSDSPNKASIGTVSRGVWFVTLAWLLDHGPNGPFFRLLPPSDKPPHHH